LAAAASDSIPPFVINNLQGENMGNEPKGKIVCDASVAGDAMHTIWQRHESLTCHLHEAVRTAADTHNRHELSIGCNRTTPAELEKALADLVQQIVGRDRLDSFVELLLMTRTMDFFESL
jgi:hypothetical protein